MKRLIYFFAAVVLFATAGCSGQKQTKAADQKIQEATLTVQGSCEMCKERIEATAKNIVGVASAAWDADSKTLLLGFDAKKTSLEVISKAIAAAGHDTDKDVAPDEVYDVLPPCCKYR